MATETTLENQKQIFGHPIGLYVLFFNRNVGTFFLLWHACYFSPLSCR
jgi:hypothetical protein